MKRLLIVFCLMFSFSKAFAQASVDATSATTLSPFAAATLLMESAVVTSIAPYASTLAMSHQARGVAGQEQLRDELVALNDDIVSGAVKSIEEVRQPALKEFLSEIAANEEQMELINASITEGSELHRVSVAVIVSLLSM